MQFNYNLVLGRGVRGGGVCCKQCFGPASYAETMRITTKKDASGKIIRALISSLFGERNRKGNPKVI